MEPVVRLADDADAAAIGRLLRDFNREFNEPTPDPEELAARMLQLLSLDTIVLLAGRGPDGVAVLRFRPAVWTQALECYLAELYVAPAKRRQGIGRALMLSALDAARSRGADRMDLGTSEDDRHAIALYESLGFTNRESGPDGPLTYFYEREL